MLMSSSEICGSKEFRWQIRPLVCGGEKRPAGVSWAGVEKVAGGWGQAPVVVKDGGERHVGLVKWMSW